MKGAEGCGGRVFWEEKREALGGRAECSGKGDEKGVDQDALQGEPSLALFQSYGGQAPPWLTATAREGIDGGAP